MRAFTVSHSGNTQIDNIMVTTYHIMKSIHISRTTTSLLFSDEEKLFKFLGAKVTVKLQLSAPGAGIAEVAKR